MRDIIPFFNSIDEITPDCIRALFRDDPDYQPYARDYDKTCQFLSEYRGSPDTFNAYRRDVERFVQWLWGIEKRTLSEMTRQDIHAFMDFFNSPPEALERKTSVARFKFVQGRYVPNPEWRPFTIKTKKSFSNNTRRSLLAILSSYFAYLVQDGYIDINPVMMLRQKSQYIVKESTKRQVRRLSNDHWRTVLQVIRADIVNNQRRAQRALFIVSCFYLMALRISELSSEKHQPKTMGSFFRDGEKRWWYKVIGKGNKERSVPVNADMLEALREYRAARNLTPLPAPGEETSLIENFSDPYSGLTSRMIRNIVTMYFNKAIAELKKTDPEEAGQMEKATVHWLRHTSISEQVKVRENSHTQTDAGHADYRTTDAYNDIFDGERHESMEKLRLEAK